MSSPLVLGGYDEHLHEQMLFNLLHGSGLFSPSPILKSGPYYPGLELFSAFWIRMTGLSTILAMSLVVLLCRLLLVLIIYRAALLVSPSHRGASLVVAFYATSQQFYFFNSQFSYQTLALTLGLGGLYLLRRAQFADGIAARRFFFSASLVLIATVITHHVTSWIVLAFLIAWAMATPKGGRAVLVRGAVVMGLAVAIWTTILAAPLANYFGPIFSETAQSIQTFLGGTSGHQVFGGNAGTAPTPHWERLVLIVYTLSCTLAALVCAWVMLSQAFRTRNRLLGLLGFLCLIFPITDAAHFEPSIGALGDRASTFLFLPLALSCSLIVQRDPRVTRRGARTFNPIRPAALIALIGGTAVVFMGGSLLGSSPDWNRLPGPYLVSAEARTQDPETMAAAEWSAANLPAGSRVVADRIPEVLLSSLARLWPVVEPQKGLVPGYLFFTETWGPQQTKIVRGLHIEYLYVDTRLADSLPLVGSYMPDVANPEPRINVADVDKFAHVKGLKAVYHHGTVTIYDTSGLGVIPQRSGFYGYHKMGLGPLDFILGIVVVLIVFLIRKRMTWMRSAARDLGALGTTLAVMAISIFISAALLGLRIMPGPGFGLGVVVASASILAVRHRRDGLRFVPRLRMPQRMDSLVFVGLVAGVSGLVIAIYAAWIVDVVDVNAILRAVS
jgi:hypothetical protein